MQGSSLEKWNHLPSLPQLQSSPRSGPGTTTLVDRARQADLVSSLRSLGCFSLLLHFPELDFPQVDMIPEAHPT